MGYGNFPSTTTTLLRELSEGCAAVVEVTHSNCCCNLNPPPSCKEVLWTPGPDGGMDGLVGILCDALEAALKQLWSSESLIDVSHLFNNMGGRWSCYCGFYGEVDPYQRPRRDCRSSKTLFQLGKDGAGHYHLLMRHDKRWSRSFCSAPPQWQAYRRRFFFFFFFCSETAGEQFWPK